MDQCCLPMLAACSEFRLVGFWVDLSAVLDSHRDFCSSVLCSGRLHLLEHFETIYDLTEDNMFAVQMGCRRESHEKLRAIRVASRVSHRENARPRMLVHKVLVIELGSIDRLTSCAISTGEISTLGHKSWNDAMETGVFKVKRLTRLANSFLASAESAEVL